MNLNICLGNEQCYQITVESKTYHHPLLLLLRSYSYDLYLSSLHPKLVCHLACCYQNEPRCSNNVENGYCFVVTNYIILMRCSPALVAQWQRVGLLIWKLWVLVPSWVPPSLNQHVILHCCLWVFFAYGPLLPPHSSMGTFHKGDGRSRNVSLVVSSTVSFLKEHNMIEYKYEKNPWAPLQGWCEKSDFMVHI